MSKRFITATSAVLLAAASTVSLTSPEPATTVSASSAAKVVSSSATLAARTHAAQVAAYRARVERQRRLHALTLVRATWSAAAKTLSAARAELAAAKQDVVVATSALEAAKVSATSDTSTVLADAQTALTAAQDRATSASAAVVTANAAYLRAGQNLTRIRAAYLRQVRSAARLTRAAALLANELARVRAHDRWVASTRAAVVRAALSRVGAAYTYGGEGPWGFDCSGLTMWSYAQVGISIPHYSGAQMFAPGAVTVALNQMVPGDLMYFGSGGSRHAAMYIGNGQIVEANNPSTGVRIDPAFASWNMYDYAGSTRLIY